jgi:hypothetical protein
MWLHSGLEGNAIIFTSVALGLTVMQGILLLTYVSFSVSVVLFQWWMAS